MGWLKSLLSQKKQDSERFAHLAESIEGAFEDHLGEIEKKLIAKRSIMTMQPEDVAAMQKELGAFFSVLDVPDDQKGIALSQRLDYINLKSTQWPVRDMVKRNFSDMDMEWSDMYANMDLVNYPYGTRLIPKYEYQQLSEADKANWFLTNRSRMILKLRKYMPPEDELQHIYSTIEERIVPLIPIDIVFDGFYTKAEIVIKFELHIFPQVLAPIHDTFTNRSNKTVSSTHSEKLVSTFDIKSDRHSTDQHTGERVTYNDREKPLFGELPLGHWPLSAHYYFDKYRRNHPDKSIGYSIGVYSDWRGVSANVVDHGGSHSIIGAGYIYRAYQLQIGKRYCIRTTKLKLGNYEMLVCEGNTPSSVKARVFDTSSIPSDYGLTFKATQSIMYVIVRSFDSSENFFINPLINSLTEL